MSRFSPEQIYAFARDAGFSPDQAATMTAIALAESSGDSRHHGTVGGDSRGLWNVDAAAHPPLAERFDLYDPAQNARAAFVLSRAGLDLSPWVTARGGDLAPYLRYRDEAQAAAIAHGDGPGLGRWLGIPDDRPPRQAPLVSPDVEYISTGVPFGPADVEYGILPGVPVTPAAVEYAHPFDVGGVVGGEEAAAGSESSE